MGRKQTGSLELGWGVGGRGDQGGAGSSLGRWASAEDGRLGQGHDAGRRRERVKAVSFVLRVFSCNKNE